MSRMKRYYEDELAATRRRVRNLRILVGVLFAINVISYIVCFTYFVG